jgi:hypothetical protein
MPWQIIGTVESLDNLPYLPYKVGTYGIRVEFECTRATKEGKNVKPTVIPSKS